MALSALTAGLVLPAAAAQSSGPEPHDRTRVVKPAARDVQSSQGASGGTTAPGLRGRDGMQLSRTTRPVAPGARLTSFERLESDKWLRADALSLELDGGGKNSHGEGDSNSGDKTGGTGTRAEYLSAGQVSRRKPVSELAAGHDAGKGRRTVAAINADFFDIDGTGAPLGPGLHDGAPTHSPAAGSPGAVGVGPQAAGRILSLYFDGTLTLPGGKERLGAYNAADVPDGGIGVYNSQWGTADRSLTTDGTTETTEVAVRDGKVISVSGEPGKGSIAEGTSVLVGRGAGAKTLARLEPGEPVSWEYRTRTDDGSPVPRTAVGGRGLLVVDGKAQNWEGRPNNTAAPRTAVGFSRDGSTMHVLTVDGRQAASGGVTLTELALMMKKLGAHNALNLDGGGSSTLLARRPGDREPQLENSPSDGEERKVPNGLAITAPEGSGRLRGFRVGTAAAPETSPTADNVPGGHPERVFPGLTRKLTATGYDETYGPAGGARPEWRSERPAVGRTDSRGVFRARGTGSTDVTAAHGGAEGSTELTVVGDLARIRPSEDRVGLADGADEGSFGILGFDAGGTSAPVDPEDVQLDYDRSRFSITPDTPGGGFTVRAGKGQDSAAGIVDATVGGRTTRLAVTVGLHDQHISGFDDVEDWKFSGARAEGSVSSDPEGRTDAAMRLDYDFGRSDATRAAYAAPPRQLPVAGQPQSFTMWIRGDGKGAWPSLHLKDAAGTDHVLRGPHIDWEGWKQVTFDVPEGTAFPLRVHRVYLAETRPGAQYEGSVVLDELVARTPPDVELPATPRDEDPLISTASDVAGRDWRFAVMSDAQFVARDPDSHTVRQARRTLREIRAAGPDFVLVNGDLVDEGSPEDLKFARKILEEELGDDVEWFYVPGNHEVAGGSIGEFTREFGPARRTFDHEGTRFITLDTSSLTLRGGGYGQFQELRRQLISAAKDPAVRSVAVVQHVPPRDPTSQQASRLTDRMEADLLEDWLSGFRKRSGKGAAFIGSHVGVFDASRVDGVPYLVNGNSGKAPASAPGNGGFTGWSLLGVDRDGRPDDSGRRDGSGPGDGERGAGEARPSDGWLAAQTRAHVDGLVLDAPARLPVGAHEKASATVLQNEDTGAGEDRGGAVREVPVGWPLSADWSGSRNLCVITGDPGRPYSGGVKGRPVRPGQPGRGCAASYDPRTDTLTAHRAGAVTLAVTVNGDRAQRRVTLTR